jgi:pilus assembly protein CpaB
MVHLVRDQSRGIQDTVTRTILQDIKVFAVDDIVDLEREKEGVKRIAAKTISLLVTPEQAAKVVLATQMGTINLVMRSPEDDQRVANFQATPSELFGSPAKSERKKESLMEAEGNPKAEKSTGLFDFLQAVKTKPTTTASRETPARETWTMRVLKPGDVSQVQFEEDKSDKTSVFGGWKTVTEGSSEPVPTPHATTPPAPPKISPPPTGRVPSPDEKG